MDRAAAMVAEWFSLDERLIFQSVSNAFHFNWKGELESKVLDSFKADSWASVSSE